MSQFAKTSLCTAGLIFLSAAAIAHSQPQAPAPASPDQAQAQAQAEAQAKAQAQAQIDIVAKRLCKAEPVVGTRLAVKRKCDTPAQLAQYRNHAREMIENHRQRTPCLMGMEVGEGSLMPC